MPDPVIGLHLGGDTFYVHAYVAEVRELAKESPKLVEFEQSNGRTIWIRPDRIDAMWEYLRA